MLHEGHKYFEQFKEGEHSLIDAKKYQTGLYMLNTIAYVGLFMTIFNIKIKEIELIS